MTRPLALDIFCGAGGATLGLERAGYRTFGIDLWDVACATHAANGMHALQADLMGFDWSALRFHGLELLWASPPCQPFSSAGNGVGEYDPRDGMPAYLAALDALRPPVTIMENVRGLTFKKHRAYLERVVSDVASLGYQVEWRVLNAADYGVPQTRQRLILVGRSDERPVWPTQTHADGRKELPSGRRPWVTMAEALGRASSVAQLAEVTDFRLDPGETHTPEGERWPHVAGTISLQRRQNGAPPIDAALVPSPTITATAFSTSQWQVRDTREMAPTSRVIGVSVAEAATLQGFPDWFEFTGSRSAQFKQIGNAVPPRLAEVVVEANRTAQAEAA